MTPPKSIRRRLTPPKQVRDAIKGGYKKVESQVRKATLSVTRGTPLEKVGTSLTRFSINDPGRSVGRVLNAARKDATAAGKGFVRRVVGESVRDAAGGLGSSIDDAVGSTGLIRTNFADQFTQSANEIARSAEEAFERSIGSAVDSLASSFVPPRRDASSTFGSGLNLSERGARGAGVVRAGGADADRARFLPTDQPLAQIAGVNITPTTAALVAVAAVLALRR